MIIEQEKSEIIASTAKETSAFNIQVNTAAFTILSDKLYQDKILAVVREYISNAYDIHVQEDKKIPCEITLPTNIYRNFEVRDFGTGLSTEDIQELFCTYFASSKSNTNSQIGGFGLGCKAGFAYSDSFSVTSWYNGVKTNYIMSKIDNVPTCIVGRSVASTEPSGLKISIPMPNDFELRDKKEWETKVIRVMDGFPRWFASDAILEKLLPVDLVTRYQNKLLNYSAKGDTLIYGNFELDNPLFEYIRVNLGDFILRTTFNGNLFFDIGEIDITPSREQVELTEKTKQAINNRKMAFIEMLENHREKIKDMSIYDAYHYLNNTFEGTSVSVDFNYSFSVCKKEPLQDYVNSSIAELFSQPKDVLIALQDAFYRNKTFYKIYGNSKQLKELLEKIGFTNVKTNTDKKQSGKQKYSVTLFNYKTKTFEDCFYSLEELIELKPNHKIICNLGHYNESFVEKIFTEYGNEIGCNIIFATSLPNKIRNRIYRSNILSLYTIVDKLSIKLNKVLNINLFILYKYFSSYGLEVIKKPEVVFEDYVTRPYIENVLINMIYKNKDKYNVIGHISNLDNILINYKSYPDTLKKLVEKDIKTLIKDAVKLIKANPKTKINNL